MPSPLYLDLQPKQKQSQKQIQNIIMSPKMQQAIYFLQLPIVELIPFIESELQQNPVLEYLEENTGSKDNDSNEESEQAEKELDFSVEDFGVLNVYEEEFQGYLADVEPEATSKEEQKRKNYLDSLIPSEETLFEHLMQQANEVFEDKDDLAMAEVIIGNLDSCGFLHTSLNEIAVLNEMDEEVLERLLKTIQTFDPPGVGARTIQESLLIQLRCQKREETLAYQIILKHYDNLLQNHIPAIEKDLQCSAEEINSAVRLYISRLDLHPGSGFSHKLTQYIIPDVIVSLDGDSLAVKANDEMIPSIRVNSSYLRRLRDESVSPEEKEYIHAKMTAAKWLMRNINQRNETLRKIVLALVEKNRSFLTAPNGQIVPLTMGVLAKELGLHESTITRAVANKYIQTPLGMYPLRAFFSHGYNRDGEGDISSKAVKNLLLELINHEDKKHPYSDDDLAEKLHAHGVPCARRTIAKYRRELSLGNSLQRKRY